MPGFVCAGICCGRPRKIVAGSNFEKDSRNSYRSQAGLQKCPARNERLMATQAGSDAEDDFRRVNPQYGRFRRLGLDFLLASDFQHLLARHYCDYGGSAPVPRTVAHRAAERSLLLGNPHSGNAQGRRTYSAIQSMRRVVLQFLDAPPDTFEVIFASGATGALKVRADLPPHCPSTLTQPSPFHSASRREFLCAWVHIGARVGRRLSRLRQRHRGVGCGAWCPCA